MVEAIKAGEITWEQYTAQYVQLMRDRYVQHKAAFKQVCESGEVVLLCYCSRDKKGKECHRYLLKDVLMQMAKSLGIKAEYAGEAMTYRNEQQTQTMRHARNKKRPLKRK